SFNSKFSKPATLPFTEWGSAWHSLQRSAAFRVQAAKLPAGVVVPKVEPKFEAPFLGFTRTAEIWNSRACMIGLIGTFIVELILNKGILQLIGVEIGKGLDIPLLNGIASKMSSSDLSYLLMSMTTLDSVFFMSSAIRMPYNLQCFWFKVNRNSDLMHIKMELDNYSLSATKSPGLIY
ncbi:High-light-induced protein, chloroplastic, partial [Prunus dulcis]